MGKITNDILTEDEINTLASVLITNTDDSEKITIEDAVETRWEKAFDYFQKNQAKFAKIAFMDIFKWFYYLGVNTTVKSKDISIEEVMKMVENEEFLRNISEILKDPNKVPDNAILDVDDKNNKVKLISECNGYNCSCSPQREDSCISEDDEKCVITIPMTKLNKLLNIEGD